MGGAGLRVGEEGEGAVEEAVGGVGALDAGEERGFEGDSGGLLVVLVEGLSREEGRFGGWSRGVAVADLLCVEAQVLLQLFELRCVAGGFEKGCWG